MSHQTSATWCSFGSVIQHGKHTVCMWINCMTTHVLAGFLPSITHTIHTTQNPISNQIIYSKYIWQQQESECMSFCTIMSTDATDALLWCKNSHQLLYISTCQLKLISRRRVFTEVLFPQLWISKQGSRDLLCHGCQCGEIDGVISA